METRPMSIQRANEGVPSFGGCLPNCGRQGLNAGESVIRRMQNDVTAYYSVALQGSHHVPSSMQHRDSAAVARLSLSHYAAPA